MIFTLVVLALLALAWLGLGYWLSGRLLYPPHQPLTRTPGDCGLDYEDVAFPSADGLALKGWWIPAWSEPRPQGPAATIILLHPLFANRQGSCAQRQGWPPLFQTDLDLLKTACVFHQAGYAVLTFDFRNHGESQAGISAGGLNEDQDVVGAVDYAFKRLEALALAERTAAAGTPLAGTQPAGAAGARKPAAKTPRVGLVGFGKGAAAAITAIGRVKGDARTIRVFSADNEGATGWTDFPPANVKMLRFLVAVQPASLRTTLGGLIRQTAAGLPLDLVLVPLVDRLCQWRGGYPLDAALLLKFAAEVNVPALYVQPRQDPWTGSYRPDGRSEAQAFYEATASPKEMYWIDTPGGRADACDDISAHPERILAFISRQAGG